MALNAKQGSAGSPVVKESSFAQHCHKEVQGTSFGAVCGDKWYQPSSHHFMVTHGICAPTTLQCEQCKGCGIPKEWESKQIGGDHFHVLEEQDSDVLQCGTVPLQLLLLSS